MTPEGRLQTSAQTLRIARRMEDALGRAETDMIPHLHEGSTWRGNQGCGARRGVDGFVCGWQRHFRAAFADRVDHTEQFIVDGDWAACFGYHVATDRGPFMGAARTGQRMRIPYMDFWRVADGRIADTPVFVGFGSALAQLGHDVFGSHGWEISDHGDDAASNSTT